MFQQIWTGRVSLRSLFWSNPGYNISQGLNRMCKNHLYHMWCLQLWLGSRWERNLQLWSANIVDIISWHVLRKKLLPQPMFLLVFCAYVCKDPVNIYLILYFLDYNYKIARIKCTVNKEPSPRRRFLDYLNHRMFMF